MFVTNWISTTKIQKISEITNFFRHYFLSRTEVISSVNVKKSGSIFLFAEQKTAIFILLYLLFDNVLSVVY